MENPLDQSSISSPSQLVVSRIAGAYSEGIYFSDTTAVSDIHSRAIIPVGSGNLKYKDKRGVAHIIPVFDGTQYPIATNFIYATGTDTGITDVILLF